MFEAKERQHKACGPLTNVPFCEIAAKWQKIAD